jgi:tetratricopeptide (TPR) repeat protein
VGHAETVLAILRSAGGRSDFSTTDDERNRLSFRANFDLGNAISSGTGTPRDPRRGLVKYERALAIGRDLARSDGPISHDDLSDLYERMAIAARDSFAYWNAKDWLINAIDELRRGSGNGAQLAQLYFELSAIQEELNDPSAAESVRAAQHIVASAGQRGGSPLMPLKRNGVWLGHYRLGQLAMRPSSRNLAAAHLHFEAALKAATVLHDVTAKEFVPTLQLCLSWLGLGSCYLNGNRYRDARTALDKAVTFGRAALKFGSDPDCAHAVWDAELKLAQASLALEQIETAAEHLQRADSALGLLDESESDLPKIQTMLHHGDHFAARGKMDEAISCYASCIEGARALFDERQNPHGWPVMADAAERIGATARQMREFHLRARNQVDPKVATGKALMDPSTPQTSATAAVPPVAAAGSTKLHAIRGGRAGTQAP